MEEEKNKGQAKEEEELLNPDDFDEEEDEEEETDEPAETDPSKTKKPDESEKSAEESDEEEKKKEKAKKDAHFAELRRQKEAKEKADKAEQERLAREQKIREEATLQAELGLLKTNPYTGEAITDAEDLKIYKLQKELEDEGKDPINDLPKRIAENARKAAAEQQKKLETEQKAKKEVDEKVNREINELREKYPKVNLAELARDELFKECLNGRAGRWTQVEIYELYLQKKAEAEKKRQEEETKELVDEGAKKITKTPSSSANGGKTSKSVEDMTREEFKAYFERKYG